LPKETTSEDTQQGVLASLLQSKELKIFELEGRGLIRRT
jgi:hypothetical protein